MRTFFWGMEDELCIVKETSTNQFVITSQLKGTQPTSLTIDSHDSNLIYCATYDHGLWRCEDGVENWIAIGKSNPYHESNKGDGIR